MTGMATMVGDWLEYAGWDTRPEAGYPVYPGPEILDEPDQAVFITMGGGPGYTTEEPATDASQFQARVRGPSDDADAAETAARALDALILGALFPVVIDDITIVHVHRMGGPPAVLPLDPTDRRFEFTASYILVTGV
jgi:hypothetical protein